MSEKVANSHNDFVRRMIREMWIIAEQRPSALNVMAESLLLGVGMLNFPQDPRKQAIMIQEIADAASDRAKAARP